MNIKTFAALAGAVAMLAASACNDGKSYAELLTDEAHAINNYLANQTVVMTVPDDGNFITGKDAPFYRLDEDGNVYMQIVTGGNMNDMAANDDLIYFRFIKYNLLNYNPWTNKLPEGWGNANDPTQGSASFRYGNLSLSTSAQWGSGVQSPLAYVGMNSEVNLVIRSQYGWQAEISNVIPYLVNVKYDRSGTYVPAGNGEGDEETDGNGDESEEADGSESN